MSDEEDDADCRVIGLQSRSQLKDSLVWLFESLLLPCPHGARQALMD